MEKFLSSFFLLLLLSCSCGVEALITNFCGAVGEGGPGPGLEWACGGLWWACGGLWWALVGLKGCWWVFDGLWWALVGFGGLGGLG